MTPLICPAAALPTLLTKTHATASAIPISGNKRPTSQSSTLPRFDELELRIKVGIDCGGWAFGSGFIPKISVSHAGSLSGKGWGQQASCPTTLALTTKATALAESY